jgi:hypothetical protein
MIIAPLCCIIPACGGIAMLVGRCADAGLFVFFVLSYKTAFWKKYLVKFVKAGKSIPQFDGGQRFIRRFSSLCIHAVSVTAVKV